MTKKVLTALFVVLAFASTSFAADDVICKAKEEVKPQYPEMARKLNLFGVVRVEVTVSPSGSASNTKVLGGHPLLAASAIQAIKAAKWETPSSGNVCVASIQFKQ